MSWRALLRRLWWLLRPVPKMCPKCGDVTEKKEKMWDPVYTARRTHKWRECVACGWRDDSNEPFDRFIEQEKRALERRLRRHIA